MCKKVIKNIKAEINKIENHFFLQGQINPSAIWKLRKEKDITTYTQILK